MMIRRIGVFAASVMMAGASFAADAPMAPPTPAATTPSLVSASPAGAEVYFISPQDGETVAGTFVVRFGLKGMGVAPAGADLPNTGHHHILIDHQGEVSLTTPLPASDQVKHFGAGQTETTLTLAPGKHTLQLVLGNHLHIPHNPPVMSKVITVNVKG
jgi:Domain of unknown function (DUF4399)